MDSHPFYKFLYDIPPEDIDTTGDKEKRLWGCFRQFLDDNGGEDFICSFAKTSGCQPGSLCGSCSQYVIDSYDKVMKEVELRMHEDGNVEATHLLGMLVKIFSWNSAGLMCHDIEKYKNKRNYIRGKSKLCDVICIQETHEGDDTDLGDIRVIWGHEYFIFSSSVSNSTGGVLIMIRRSLISRAQSYEKVVIVAGRILAIEVRFEKRVTCYINIHLHSDDGTNNGKINMLKLLKNYIDARKGYFIYIIGDFNFVEDLGSRMNISDGEVCGRVCPVSKFWQDEFDGFDELYQPDLTRFPYSSDGTASRIDRIYANMDIEAHGLLNIRVSICDFFPDFLLSDHLPLISAISVKDICHHSSAIPHFVFKSSDFREILENNCSRFQFSDCCWAKIREYKQLAHDSFGDFKNLCFERGAKTPEERIFWALRALRAHHFNNTLDFLKAMSAAPVLQIEGTPNSLPTTQAHLQHIRDILKQARDTSIEEKRMELEAIKDEKGYREEKRKDNLVRELMVHNPKRRRLGIGAVRKEDGNVINDRDESMDYLGKFWGKKFEASQIEEDSAKNFVQRFARKFPETTWTMGWLAFMSLMASLKNSAPGPDGIPYSGWNINWHAQISLFLAYMTWINTGYVTFLFNVAYLWLLPKTSPCDGYFSPGDTRPLTGSNCDAKVLAMALAESINLVINNWAIGCQRGFIRSRCMLDNVIDIESKAACLTRNGGNRSAIIFLDFAAAFPSLARAFIWLVLKAIGFPEVVIACIAALYASNIHVIKTSTGLRFLFVAESGVMQGSPLSSLIFVIVTDCLNNFLETLLCNEDLLRVYADDTALILKNLFMNGFRFAEAFDLVGRISALKLNGKKCVCIPLWSNFDKDLIREFLSREIPFWKDFIIQGFGKYLGFQVGPEAGNREWTMIMRKMQEMGSLIKVLGLPILHRIILFNTLVTSKAPFVAQLRIPDTKFLKDFYKLSVSVLGGPGNWVPNMLPYVLKSHCYFPVEIRHMNSLCLATRIRTAFRTTAAWRDAWHVFSHPRGEDHDYLRHPLEKWVEELSFSVLHEALSNFNLAQFARFCLSEGVEDCKIRDLDNFQKHVYQYCRRCSVNFDLARTFEDRFRRRAWFEECEIRDMAEKAACFISVISGKVPPCVIFAVINTYLNGWSTGARHQKRENRCYLCVECVGEDSLEHYASCSFQWNVFASKFGRSVFPMTLPRFLGLYARDSEDAVKYACHMYAVRSAFNYQRFKIGTGASLSLVSVRIEAGYRTACLHCSGLSGRLAQIDPPPPCSGPYSPPFASSSLLHDYSSDFDSDDSAVLDVDSEDF